jgi:hypothetical protein
VGKVPNSLLAALSDAVIKHPSLVLLDTGWLAGVCSDVLAEINFV